MEIHNKLAGTDIKKVWMITANKYMLKSLKIISRNVSDSTYYSTANKEIFLEAFGGAKSVGKSAFLLEINGVNVLLDCGIAFSQPYYSGKLNQIYNKLNYVYCSHAHLDHSGLIPMILKNIYRKVILTPPTFDFSYRLWKDYLRLRVPYNHPYEVEDVNFNELFYKKTFKLLYNGNPFKLKEQNYLDGNVTATLYNAGHILGSSMILIDNGDKKILYTGDFNYRDTCFLKKAEFPDEINILITECTNGNRSVKDQDLLKEELKDEIKETLNNQGTVIVPVYAVGRSPEILSIISEDPEIIKYPIYIGGMINSMNSVIQRFLNETGDWKFSDEIKKNDFIFSPDNLFRDLRSEDDDVIYDENKPKLIVTTSGVMQKGTYSYSLFDRFKHSSKHKIIFNGYLFKNSPGEVLINNRVNLFDDYFGVGPTRINIQKRWIDFSGHASREDHIKLLKSLNGLEKVIPVHGDNSNYSEYIKFAREIGKERGFEVVQINDGERVKLS
ncbi:MBL fold metallo-hydrolase RNA specificity domain-containing protein [Nanoarchaeota archaeon]